jgi:hypothetical protein
MHQEDSDGDSAGDTCDSCDVIIDPASLSTTFGELSQFSAAVSGTCNTPCYKWDVVSSVGSIINSEGLYTAGNGVGLDRVVLTDTCNQNISHTAYVKIIVNEPLWGRTCGSFDDDEHAYDIQHTFDGGYIVAGRTESFGAGSSDMLVLKLDPGGTVSWQKTYGGNYFEYAKSIQQTKDGGYIVGGRTTSFGAGSTDIWILKLDQDGNVTWQKTYGGDSTDYANAIQQTTDGGFIVVGSTFSFGAGSSDILVLKLDSNGYATWQNVYGGIYIDRGESVQQTLDGGYIVAGWSTDADPHSPAECIQILKLDNSGNIIWKKSNTLSYFNAAYSILQTTDEGYIVAGGNDNDLFVLKLDASGDAIWEKNYGSSYSDLAFSIQQTADGGYIVAGYTEIDFYHSDLWILSIDENGDVLWQKTYGGSNDDVGYSIQHTLNGGYIVAGESRSLGSGGSTKDLLLLKLDCFGEIPGCDIIENSDVAIYTPSGSIRDSTVTFSPTSANYTDTNIIPGIPSVNVNVICEGFQNDSENDGIVNDCDKCPKHYNPNQEDVDEDAIGDICDNCPDGFNPDQTDSDSDCLGDLCDEFPEIYDPTQPDSDSDEVGDACDNCPEVSNSDQLDSYPPQGNNVGDACDCEGNFNCAADQDVDGSDASLFKTDFGRSGFNNPCEFGDQCNGDFECDGDVDGTDAALFKSDFGRSGFNNPCPVCTQGDWCLYP